MVQESFPMGFNRLELSFPKPLLVVHSLPHPHRFLHSCHFREHLNCILIRQVFIYCHQPSLHGTFFPGGNPPQNIQKWGLSERWGRDIGDKDNIPKLSRAHISDPPPLPALNSPTLPSFFSPCFWAKSLLALDFQT